MWKTIVVGFTLLTFTACTTLQAIPDTDPASVRSNVAVGDQVRIVANNQRVYDMTVDQVADDALFGREKDGKRYRVPFGSIRSLEKRVAAEGSTTWTVVGILGAIALAIGLAGGGGGGGGGSDSGY